MPALIKPETVKVLTRDGEVHVSITLELNINLNTDTVKVSAQSTVEKPEKKEKESSIWEIPDFGTSPKLNFGK